MLAEARDALERWAARPWAWAAIAAADLALGLAIVRFVPYTEIDWRAYMQEVEGPLVHGDWNYTNLRGDTGPLVYPAGFVWVFAALRAVTDNGTNIFRAQIIFSALHALLVFFALGAIFHQPQRTRPAVAEAKYQPRAHVSPPLWLIPALLFSRRVHSIFALRLFNDGVAMLLLFIALFLLVRRRWTSACVMYSLALSIKMNIVLFAPGLAVLLLQTGGLAASAARGFLCLAIQVGLAWPFLTTDASAYLHRAFELDRVFMFKWTVNFKFLPEDVFVSRELALLLLGLTLLCWLLFGHVHYAVPTQQRWGLLGLLGTSLRHPFTARMDPGFLASREYVDHALLTMFSSNFIGIVFARSIHYQFYVWYFHSLGYLAYRARLPVLLSLAVLLGIEYCYNVFPATPATSAFLQCCHFLLLASLWLVPVRKAHLKVA